MKVVSVYTLAEVAFGAILSLGIGVKLGSSSTNLYDLASRIDSDEGRIQSLRLSACVSTAPANEPEFTRLNDTTALLKKTATDLIKLFSRESSGLDELTIPTSQKAAIQKYIQIEEAGLRAPYPVLHSLKAELESAPNTRTFAPRVPPDNGADCKTLGPNDIFPDQ